MGRKAQEGAMRQGCELTVRSPARSESVVYGFSGQSFRSTRTCRLPVRARQHKTVARRKWAAMCAHQSEEGEGLTGGGAQPHLVPRPSQPDGRLVGAASGRQTQTHPLRQGLEGPAATVMAPLSLVQRWRWTRRRSPTNVARSKISSSDSSCPEQDWRIVTIIQSWNRVTLRAAKRLP